MTDEQSSPPGHDPELENGYSDTDAPQTLQTSNAPSVAASPGRVLVSIILVVSAVGFVLYSLLGGDEKKQEEEDNGEPQKIASATVEPPPPPPPIEPPTSTQDALNDASLIPPPPGPPEFPPLGDGMDANTGAIGEEGEEVPQLSDEQRQGRLKSPMVVMDAGGGGPGNAAQQRAENSLAGRDANLAFSRDAINASQTERAEATTIGNLQYTVAQGKIIDAILETAINTDLPGTLRAIVSRDVYAEAGKTPAVPKGSRLIGSYNTGVLRGQTRVFIVWTRLIRPDGIDIAIGSPGIDALGRAGMTGFVDNKYMEAFSSSLLTSTVGIGVAIAAESALGDSEVSQTVNTDGSITSSGSAGAQATSQAVQSLGDVASRIVQDMMDLRPTITVNQGTRVNVMVNRDLVFPADIVKQAQFVD